jgi:hypothetical protein
MEYIILLYDDGFYIYEDSSSIQMDILGSLFKSDLRCPGTSLDDWIFDDNKGLGTSGNLIYLEKEDNYILLSDLYDEDKENPVELKISRQQLAQLIYDWQEKVCKLKPQEVTITYENDTFTLTTSD